MTPNLFKTNRDGALYGTCSLITAVHGFTTRCGGVSPGIYESLNLGENRGDDPENIRENYSRLGHVAGFDIRNMVFSRQVHGNTARIVTDADVHELFEPVPYEADALVTDVPGLTLVIFTADCVPILLYDPEAGVIAAVHAGWRSTAADVAGCAVEAMRRLGANPHKIRAAVGPAIGACCFETDSDVPEALEKTYGGDFAHPAAVPGKYLVDLKAANRAALITRGLDPGNVAVSDECTYCNSGKYWSHRKTKGNRGSQAAFISYGSESF